ncbi:SRPBCC family protein [Lentzea albida]|uniref:Polyketide cyclase / dehydrase and lipid transport n=1 Tax=Lentzea albida TaxID=65499 RepID=A0A1H9WE32_9PSEU|nr:SRPBCC family protein [Lentzea albida]SES32170.1 Polyketide cyclase / dehydrase and lipid transport [Lentzea albida]
MTSILENTPVMDLDPADFGFRRRAWVPVPPARLYDIVSDVSLIGRWSPSASEVAYDDGAGPEPGAWFSGHNRRGDRTWVSRSQVLEARPGAEFSFVVGGLDDGIVRWRWTMHEDGDGSVVTQEWQLLRMDPVLGATRRDVEALRDEMETSVESTLVSLAKWLH